MLQNLSNYAKLKDIKFMFVVYLLFLCNINSSFLHVTSFSIFYITVCCTVYKYVFTNANWTLAIYVAELEIYNVQYNLLCYNNLKLTPTFYK